MKYSWHYLKLNHTAKTNSRKISTPMPTFRLLLPGLTSFFKSFNVAILISYFRY